MIVITIMVGIMLLVIGIAIFLSVDKTITKITSIVITTILTIGLVIGTIWYYTSTESGKRAWKDFQSNVDNGIERIVIIYDINGNEIKRYEGKFDVSYDSNRIKFDDENGKRHVVYYTTGTVVIDEK